VPEPLQELLPRLLTERGLSKYAFAKALGMHTPTLHAILAGKRPFPEARIAEAVKVLGVKGKERLEFEDAAGMTHATERIWKLVERLERRH
jgi:plasmid maintenance system antidote protein VapI